MAAFIEVESKTMVKKRVCVVYVEGVVHPEVDLESRFASAWNLERSTCSIDLLYRKTLMKSHVFKVIEPIMSELYVDGGMIDKLEVSAALEDSKVLRVVITGKVNWDYLGLVGDSI